MSTPSGLGKSAEKGKSKFTAININTIYKGKSVETQKTTVARQHGLQSLGKVGSARRMPPPASLPSLKSENSGNDPNVNLVPSGPGWGKESGAQQSSQPQPAATQSQQGQQTPTQQKQTTQPGATGTLSGGNTTTQQQTPTTGGNNGAKSWSSVTQGSSGQGNYSRGYFQEDFPTLATDKLESGAGPQKATTEEKSRDAQYGPGPSLRPQNVGNWREGGGLGVAAGLQGAPEAGGLQMSDGGLKGEREPSPRANMPSQGGAMPPHPMAGGPMMPPRFHGMMPHYMYRGMPGPYPPHNFPGMRPPYPFPGDRNMTAPPGGDRRPGDPIEDTYKRPSIIKDKDLKEFDDILDANDSGWAGASGEIDYSEKLVFSDDEDSSKDKGSGQGDDKSRKPKSPHEGRDPRDDFDRTKDGRGPPASRAAWEASQGRPMPGQPPYGRIPFDHRGPMPPYPPQHPGYRMAPPHPGQRPPYPVPVGPPIQRRPSENDDDEMWRQRRQQQNEEMSLAVERARQRREEEEKRIEEERKERAREKLHALEKRSPRKDDGSDDVDGEVSVGRRRTESESSDKSTGYRENKPATHTYKNQDYKSQVPPRFQKTQDGAAPAQPATQKSAHGAQSPSQPGSQGGARPPQGHPMPPPWYDPRDPRTWTPYPPQMMHSMMYQGIRRRTESDRSNEDGDRIEKKGEMFDNPRTWDPRSPYGPPMGAYEDMRRGPMPPAHFEYDRREYEQRRMEYERRMYVEKQRMEAIERSRSVEDRERAPSRESHDSRDSDHVRSEPDNQPRDILRQDSQTSRSSSSPSEVKVASKPAPVQRDPFDEESDQDSTVANKDVKRDRREGKLADDRKYEKGDSSKDSRDDRRENRREIILPPPSRPGRNHHAPVPINHQYSRQSEPPKSNYTSLKRSTNQNEVKAPERKTDSPKEVASTVWNKQSKKADSKENLKENQDENKMLETPDQTDKMPKATVAKDDEKKKTGDRNKWDNTQDNRSSKWDGSHDNRGKWDQKRDNDYRSERRDSDKPPVKRSRDDRPQRDDRAPRDDRPPREGRDNRPDRRNKEYYYEDRENRYERSSSRGRGRGAREYVRGGRGRSSQSAGRGGGARWGYDAKPAGGRGTSRYSSSDNTKAKVSAKDGNKEGSDWSETESVDSKSRLRGRDETSDASGDEASAPVSEASSDKASVSRGASSEKDTEKIATATKPTENVWSSSPWSKKNEDISDKLESEDKVGDNKEEYKKTEPIKEKDGRKDEKHSRNRESDRRIHHKDEERHYRRDDRHRNRDDDYGRYDRRDDSRQWKSRGEDDRGGRRGSSYSARGDSRGDYRGRGRGRGRGEGRGGRDNSRYNSAPPAAKTGGFGRPPAKEDVEDNVWKPEEDKKEHNRENKGRDKTYNKRNDNAPPRFTRGNSAAGRSSSRGMERGGRGRGSRGTGRGSSTSATRVTPTKKSPPLHRHNSVDLNNDQEEWETASESSDFDRRERRDEAKNAKNDSGKDKKDVKRSFSNQRPSSQSWKSERTGDRARSKEKTPPTKVNGVAGGNKTSNGRSSKTDTAKKENVTEVFRVDEITPDDPTAIKNAINSVTIKNKKKTDINDNTKTVKTEQEKKAEVLASIDINNYASVVIIDDQPEVSHEDPDMLFESNEGFQEVTSRKSLKIRQKAAAELEMKKIAIEKKLKEKEMLDKALAKPRSGHQTEKAGRLNKLPPRLANKQQPKEKHGGPRNTKDKEEPSSQEMSFKIEAWDNKLFKIPQPDMNAADTVPTIQGLLPNPISVPSQQMSIGSWDKSMMEQAPQQSIIQPGMEMLVEGAKYDKSDQHDSGIDISEPHNSQASSQRSSPGNDVKLNKMTDDSPNKQRQQKSRPERTTTKVGPIELPRSFGDFSLAKNDESAELKLDFTFDAELAKLTNEKPGHKLDDIPDQPKPIPLPDETETSPAKSGLSPTSPASDLGMKIDAVKNLWDATPSLPTVFEQGISHSGHNTMNTTSVTDNIDMDTSAYTSLAATMVTAMDKKTITSDVALENNVMEMDMTDMDQVTIEDVSMAVTMVSMGAVIPSSSITIGSVMPPSSMQYDGVASTLNPNALEHVSMSAVSQAQSEASNVCKVRPQQLLPNGLPELSNANNVDILSTNNVGLAAELSSNVGLTTDLSTVGLTSDLTGAVDQTNMATGYMAPQVSLYQPFQNFGSSLLQDSRYSYSMTQQQQQQVVQGTQPPQQLSFNSQTSLFLQPSPANDGYGQLNYNRSQPTFGQQLAPPQPNTVMVSSGNASLMSATIKAPNQSAFGSIHKSPMQQTMGGAQGSIPQAPSQQLFLQFDHQLLGGGQLQPQAVNNTSQNLSSQIMYPRQNVQNLQPGASSFYSQQPQQPLAQTGFYQAHQATSTLHAPLPQVTAAGPYSMQGYGLSVQPAVGTPAANQLGLVQQGSTHSAQAGMGMSGQQTYGVQPQLLGLQAPQQHTTTNASLGYMGQPIHSINSGAAVQQTHRPFSQQQAYHSTKTYGQPFMTLPTSPRTSSVLTQHSKVFSPKGYQSKAAQLSSDITLTPVTSVLSSTVTAMSGTITTTVASLKASVTTSEASKSASSSKSATTTTVASSTGKTSSVSKTASYKTGWSTGQNKGPKASQFTGSKMAPFLPNFSGAPGHLNIQQQMMMSNMFGIGPQPGRFPGPRGGLHPRPGGPPPVRGQFGSGPRQPKSDNKVGQKLFEAKSSVKSDNKSTSSSKSIDLAKQREEILKATQSFLNPDNKPRPKEFIENPKAVRKEKKAAEVAAKALEKKANK